MKLLFNFLTRSENQYSYEKKDLTNICFAYISKYNMLTTKYDKLIIKCKCKKCKEFGKENKKKLEFLNSNK